MSKNDYLSKARAWYMVKNRRPDGLAMVDVWIGWAGLILLVVSWIPGARETLRVGRTAEQPAFLMTYALATLMLFVYSVELGDGPFSLLNGLALLLVCVQLYFLFWPRATKAGARGRVKARKLR